MLLVKFGTIANFRQKKNQPSFKDGQAHDITKSKIFIKIVRVKKTFYRSKKCVNWLATEKKVRSANQITHTYTHMTFSILWKSHV